MPTVNDVTEKELQDIFWVEPEVVEGEKPVVPGVSAAVPAKEIIVATPTLATEKPVVPAVPEVIEPESIASLGDIVRTLGRDEIVTLNGKKVKAGDLWDAVQDHENKTRWQQTQGERDRTFGEERKKFRQHLPLLQKMDIDPDFARVVARTQEFYDNPELTLKRPAPDPAISAENEFDDLNLGAEPGPARSSPTSVEVVMLKREVDALKKNQELIVRRDELLQEAQGEKELELLKQDVADYAKQNNLKWDKGREDKFINLLNKFGPVTQETAKDAFYLATREDVLANTAATAADNAVTTERKSRPASPPMIGGGAASAIPALSQQDIEMVTELGIPQDRWAKLAEK